MKNSNIEVLHGVWSVGNADKGEYISEPEGRLITGGHVLIDAETQHVSAVFTARTDSSSETTIRMAGQIERTAEETFNAQFTNGTEVVFERLPDGRLQRTGYSGTTVESEMVLSHARSSIEPADRRDIVLSPILFNTMPKSGSIYILRCLAQGLGISETKIAVCLFPNDLVIRDKLDELAKGNLVSQQHLPAHDINLRFLANRLERMVVHVRDPRQAMLSWLHHLDNFEAHRDIVPACALGLEASSPALPKDYFERSFSAKIDYLLDTHFPQLLSWTEGWVEAAESKTGPKIKITTFEDFVADPDGFLNSLLDYFDISHEQFEASNLPRKEAQTHFRKGLTDEWKEVFSDTQKSAAQKMIPKSLTKKFGW